MLAGTPVAYGAGVEQFTARNAGRWVSAHRDVLIAAAAAVIQLGGTLLAARHQGGVADLDPLGVALLLAGPASLVVRRRWPVAVLAASFAFTFAYRWLDYPGGPIWAALIVALWTTVATGHRMAAYTSLAAGWVAASWPDAWFRDEPGPGAAEVLGLLAWLFALAAGSEIVRYRGELRRAAREQEEQARRSEVEAARRRASEERLDIARELHDVLAHSISLINVQAGVALELMDERPEQARASLTTIKQASREALGEVQAVLGALRETGERPETAPAPSIANLDRLVSGARAAGLDVQVRIDGAARPLPIGTDLAAYRILQESLTNVVRHAGATAVLVTVGYGGAELTVQVDDNGRPGTPNGTSPGGSGIAGMRERATALGGELEAVRLLNGGFRVHARLPLAREAQ